MTEALDWQEWAGEVRFLLASLVMMQMKNYEMVSYLAKLNTRNDVHRERLAELLDLHEEGRFMTSPPFSQEPEVDGDA